MSSPDARVCWSPWPFWPRSPAPSRARAKVSPLVIRFLCLLLLVSCAAEVAGEQPAQFALLIGNQSYASAVGTLKNPRQDVALIGASLKKLGFTVTVLNDADYRAMDVALKRYAAELRRAGPGALGFFYYSGHGAANADTQTNYLIPVDVTSAEDDTVWYQSFQQNQIIDLLSKQAANATQFVVFDACRNELNLSGSAAKAIGADKGFVPLADTAGLLIAYATAPHRTASDAGEGGGPYAKALAEELLKPGVEAVTMFRNVQIRVKQAIGQDPWLSFPSLAPVYLAGREAKAEPPMAEPQTPFSEAGRAWDEIKDLKDIAVFDAFKKQYGPSNALYDALAAQKIAELKRQQVATPELAAPKAPISEAAQAWSVVQSTTSESVLEEFIRRFPESVYAGFAKARLEELRNSKSASKELANPVDPSNPRIFRNGTERDVTVTPGEQPEDRETALNGYWQLLGESKNCPGPGRWNWRHFIKVEHNQIFARDP